MAKISYSGWKKYHQCPKMFDIYYNERLVPKGTSSALAFGTAIDEALNALLLKTKNPVEVFRENFKLEDLKSVVWDPRDFQKGLFTDEELIEVQDKGFDFMCWASMRIKGRMLIEAYQNYILPKITKVYSVQTELNDRKGFIDAIVEIKDYGKVLLDHKTSARPYKDNAIEADTQLALYAADQGIEKIGYVVLNKQITINQTKTCSKCGFDGSGRQHSTCFNEVKGKRCHGAWKTDSNPVADIQVILEDAPEINQKLIKESISDTEKLIEAKVFPRNLNACGQMYGKPCPYYDFCWKNDKSMLEYKNNEKESK